MTSNADQILDAYQGDMSGLEFEEFLNHVAAQGDEAGYAADFIAAAAARIDACIVGGAKPVQP